MMRLKCVLATFLCVLMIPVPTVPALGWEFQMTGSMIWTYEFYNQTGSNGFFGPYNVDRGAGTTTANLNYWWNGPRLTQNIVTGQDASKSYFWVFDPIQSMSIQRSSCKGEYASVNGTIHGQATT